MNLSRLPLLTHTSLDPPFPGFGVVPTRRAGSRPGSRIDAQRDVAVEKFGEDGWVVNGRILV